MKPQQSIAATLQCVVHGSISRAALHCMVNIVRNCMFKCSGVAALLCMGFFDKFMNKIMKYSKYRKC